MVASSDPIWLQRAFSTLFRLFARVGLKTNVRKTVGIVCHMCQGAGMQSEAEYGRQMAGSGTSYQDRQRVQVQCAECGEDMELGSLAVH